MSMVCIKTYALLPQAECARAALEAAEIHAVISSDDVGGMRPEVALAMGGYRLMVNASDKNAALELLGEDD